MKRKMYWSLCITSIVVVVLTAALTLGSTYSLLLRQAQNDLANEHKLVAQSIAFAQPNEHDYLQMLDIRYDSFRVTLIQRDGTVLFDSDNDYTSMENHQDRPEVEEAFASGAGQDVRRSETMGMDTCYYAAKLDDDTVLRVSKQTRSIGAVFVSVVPLMAGVVAVILIASVVLSSWLTKRMLRPIEGFAENIDNTDDLCGYDELEPFFLKIREQNRLIKEQMEHLRVERDTIKTITSNMKEGLLLLNLERSILSVNRSALSLLDATENETESYEGKNLLHLSRSKELTDCVDQALAGTGGDLVIKKEKSACHIFASPVYNDGRVVGAIVLLLDVTEQERAEQIRREFTSNVSHELKTPLTSISGFAEMIENGMVDSGQDVKKFAGRIYREARRLITLTDDIIRLARIEEGGKLDVQPVNLYAVCESALETLRFTAEQKQVHLHLAGDAVKISGDPRMLEEMAFNLIDNAVKYNRPDGRVDVTIRQDGACAVLSVADTGIGISEEHQERIFERFYRVDKSRSKLTGGTGLGLSIVKHVVERHKGNITLESAKDAGTIVTVRLPVGE